MTPYDSPHSIEAGDEGDWAQDATEAATSRLWPETETVLLPAHAPREDKFHQPVVTGALLPVCGSFDSAGVERRTAELRDRGYRRCRLCWPQSDRHGCVSQTGGDEQ